SREALMMRQMAVLTMASCLLMPSCKRAELGAACTRTSDCGAAFFCQANHCTKACADNAACGDSGICEPSGYCQPGRPGVAGPRIFYVLGDRSTPGSFRESLRIEGENLA